MLPLRFAASSRRRKVKIATAIYTIAALVLILAVILPAAGPEFGWDFRDYWLAADRISDGNSPYAPAMLDGPIDAKGSDRYRYPPPLAVALQPLSNLPLQAASIIWLAMGIVALLAALQAVNRLFTTDKHLPFWHLGLLATLFIPFYVAAVEGNVSLLLAACYAAVLVGSWHARPALTGAGVAIGTLLKLEPALFFIWLLARRDWRASIWAVVIGTIIVALSLLAPGGREGWWQYPDIIQNILTGSGDYAQNGAPLIWLERMLDPTFHSLLRFIVVILAIIAVIFIARWQLVASFAAVSAISLLSFPVLWLHYLVVLLVAGLALWQHRPATRPYLAAAYVTAATSLSVVSIVLLLIAAAVGEGKISLASRLSRQPETVPTSSDSRSELE